MDQVAVLDEHDRLITRMLQENARVSYQELATATGLSPSTARRRVERLLNTGALKLVAVPNWMKLGIFFTAFLAISVELPYLRGVGNELAKMDEICFVGMATGEYDLLAQLVLPRNQDFVRFVTQRVALIEGVRNIQTFMIPEFIKSFEEYRLPLAPDPLYLRDGNNAYVVSEDLAEQMAR